MLERLANGTMAELQRGGGRYADPKLEGDIYRTEKLA